MCTYIMLKKCVECGEIFDRRDIDEEEYADARPHAADASEDPMGEVNTITMNSVCYDCEDSNED